MVDLIEQKIAELLSAAKQAHTSYEKDELKGIRDEQWPAWYADYLTNNGLGALIGKELGAYELTEFLEESSKQFETANNKASWRDFIAAQILEKLV